MADDYVVLARFDVHVEIRDDIDPKRASALEAFRTSEAWSAEAILAVIESMGARLSPAYVLALTTADSKALNRMMEELLGLLGCLSGLHPRSKWRDGSQELDERPQRPLWPELDQTRIRGDGAEPLPYLYETLQERWGISIPLSLWIDEITIGSTKAKKVEFKTQLEIVVAILGGLAAAPGAMDTVLKSGDWLMTQGIPAVWQPVTNYLNHLDTLYSDTCVLDFDNKQLPMQQAAVDVYHRLRREDWFLELERRAAKPVNHEPPPFRPRLR